MNWEKVINKLPSEKGIYLIASTENVHHGVFHKTPLGWYVNMFEADTDERIKLLQKELIQDNITYWSKLDLGELNRLERLKNGEI